MKYLLIYHKDDNDGIISGALINKWLKFTYKEDAKDVKDSIRKLISENEYKEKLWD